MARFYLDHNVSLHLVPALIALGHDAATARDLGLTGADDDMHLTTASDDGRILVTHDRQDFVLLHRAWHRWSRRWGVTAAHAGILVIPQAPRLPLPDAARELDRAAGWPLANELLIYRRGHLRLWSRDLVP